MPHLIYCEVGKLERFDMPKLKHYDNDHSARFITFSCFRRMPFMDLKNAKELLIEQLEIARSNKGFKLLGYVIKPEHIHLVIYPELDTKIGILVGMIKMRMAKKFFRLEDSPSTKIPKAFWQERCYDHNCRSVETIREKINYCHNNPVKRGLVESPGSWIWSSYDWYCGNRDVPISVDEFELHV